MSMKINKSIEVATFFENGKMIEKRTIDGKLYSMTIFKDLDGDGQYKMDEIVQVDVYHHFMDNSVTKDSYIDTDHDGYDDEIRTEEYDSNGNLSSSRYKIEKSIENETDPKKHNRKMTTHREANYMPVFNTIS